MMTSTNMMSIFDIIVLGAGLYMLYATYLMLAKNELKEGVMVSRADTYKKCKDIERFKQIMKWPAIALSFMAVLSGAAGIYQDYVQALPKVLYWTLYGAFMVAIVWFAAANRKAQKECF